MRSFLSGRRSRTLFAALVASLTLSACDFDIYSLPLPGGADTGSNPIEITVELEDALDLVPQSSVKVNDVSVGRVTDIELKDQIAEVTLVMRGDIGLPANAEATLRQTSLLGEKFVSITPPDIAPSSEKLADGDLIPLERTGRNPEVEEVFGALSLLLNGGGVAQLRTIAQEVNLALDGREESVKSALRQIDDFVGQLDDNKSDIIASIEQVNRLAQTINADQDSLDNALNNLPSALRSLDRQRDDLVRMLSALDDLSDVSVRVIRQSKGATINALEQLQPTLTQLADSGDAFVDAFSVALTYPFVDESVGRNPQVARNLQMGDYTNLSIELELDVLDLPGIGIPCTVLSQIPVDLPLDGILELENLCDDANEAIQLCLTEPTFANCAGLPGGVIDAVCDNLLGGALGGLCEALPLPGEEAPGANQNNGGPPNPPGVPNVPNLPDLPGLNLPGLNLGGGDGLLGLNRSAPAGTSTTSRTTVSDLVEVYDPALVSLLVPMMVVDQ